MPIIRDTMTDSLKRIVKRLDRELGPAALKSFKGFTPKRSGNARSKTRLSGKVVLAGYDYASNLDKGSSDKARKGMSGPTTKFLIKFVKKLMRK